MEELLNKKVWAEKVARTPQKLLVEKKKKKRRKKLSGLITQHTRVLSHLCAVHISCNAGTDTIRNICVRALHTVLDESFSSDILRLRLKSLSMQTGTKLWSWCIMDLKLETDQSAVCCKWGNSCTQTVYFSQTRHCRKSSAKKPVIDSSSADVLPVTELRRRSQKTACRTRTACYKPSEMPLSALHLGMTRQKNKRQQL